MTFSDRLASESTFFECLRSLKLSALCNWHNRVQNLGKKVNFHPDKVQIMRDFMLKIQNALVSVDQLHANVAQFKEEWPEAAARFMESIKPEMHRFCAAFTHKHMLLFQTGNSVSESANSSVDAFLDQNKPHSELMQTLIQYDTEQNNRKRRDLQVMKLRLPNRLKEVEDKNVRNCLQQFSNLITQKFEHQLEESKHYTATFVEVQSSFGAFEVRRRGRPMSFREVTRDVSTRLLVCPCLTRTSSGCSCRHIICVLASLGEPLFCADYFHPRWERQFELPSPEDIQADRNMPENYDAEDHNCDTMHFPDTVEYEGALHTGTDMNNGAEPCTTPFFVSKAERRTKLQKIISV